MAIDAAPSGGGGGGGGGGNSSCGGELIGITIRSFVHK